MGGKNSVRRQQAAEAAVGKCLSPGALTRSRKGPLPSYTYSSALGASEAIGSRVALQRGEGEKEKETNKQKITELEHFLPFLSPPSVFLLKDVNVNDYLQEVQRGQKDLEDPLHHGDQQDQKGRGYQQAQVHPKNGRNSGELAVSNETARVCYYSTKF